MYGLNTSHKPSQQCSEHLPRPALVRPATPNVSYLQGAQRIVVCATTVQQVHILLRVVWRLEGRDTAVRSRVEWERLIHVNCSPEEPHEDLAE